MVQRIILLAGLMAALLVGQVSDALAATLYNAQASSILTITGFFDAAGTAIAKPSDLRVEGDAQVFDRFELALGAASADTLALAEVFGSDPLNLDVGEGVALEAGASGSTSFPPVSSAESVARTDGLIFFDNLSATATYQVGFELDVSWLVDAAADVPASEAAAAEIRILLESLSGGTLLDLFELSDTSLGGGSLSASPLLASVLVLGPGEFDELGLISDATGFASSAPEPSSLLLLGSGLLCLLARRRAFLHRSRRLGCEWRASCVE
jgi:hypothetical protein